MHSISTVQHTLQFNFNTVTNTQAVDALVYALCIQLFTKHRILCDQPSYNSLVFASGQHCTFAQLALCTDTRFTVVRL